LRTKIAADVTSGNAASIDHTPTFFVNLKQIPNPRITQGSRRCSMRRSRCDGNGGGFAGDINKPQQRNNGLRGCALKNFAI